ncbi:hypothetical protein B9C88_04820 [Brevibacillus laterosporus]|uniref:DUF4288 domain-containing protein n=1 Tax=Brevibacillus laterosporus TaxID=1465 RepID=UPI000BC6C19D|nr:DUF4288 domain-containing protein [Brevibacillus laterosporus]PCN45222.1 hypothetical protein B9C88_04820 [Brevibacillus laterosporus]
MENALSNECRMKWYSVKILFESIHSGAPLPDKINADYYVSKDNKLLEESIILVKATDTEQACKLAEEYAKKAEHEYLNYYGEQVKDQFVCSLHAFELNDSEITTGVEVYSRFIHATSKETTNDIIKRYYPEALDEEEEQ